MDAAVSAERERMRALIADDASAITHQGIWQYQTARLLKLAKAHTNKTGESLGEYLERLVFADLGDKMLPPSAG